MLRSVVTDQNSIEYLVVRRQHPQCVQNLQGTLVLAARKADHLGVGPLVDAHLRVKEKLAAVRHLVLETGLAQLARR